MAHPFIGLGFNSWTEKFSRSGGEEEVSFKLVVGAPFDDAPDNSGSVYVYDLDGTNETRIIASDAASDDYFGVSVAVGNNKIVVGASYKDNPDNSGSVYIYDLDGTNQVKINASDANTNDQFGHSVAVGHNKIVVGAIGDDAPDNSGSVYVYDLDGTNQFRIIASDATTDDQFGWSVAVGNNKIVVGAIKADLSASDTAQSGAVYVYDLDGTNEVKISPSDGAAGDQFGWSVAVDNNKIVVGSSNESDQGSIYVYDLDGTNELKITALDIQFMDAFGYSVSTDNNNIVVGAPYDDDDGSRSGSAYVYDLSNSAYNYGEVKITASDASMFKFYGQSTAIGNNKIAVSSHYQRTVYVYDLDGSSVNPSTEVKINASDGAPGDSFGYAIAIG